jgi:hypothetical protein
MFPKPTGHPGARGAETASRGHPAAFTIHPGRRQNFIFQRRFPEFNGNAGHLPAFSEIRIKPTVSQPARFRDKLIYHAGLVR